MSLIRLCGISTDHSILKRKKSFSHNSFFFHITQMVLIYYNASPLCSVDLMKHIRARAKIAENKSRQRTRLTLKQLKRGHSLVSRTKLLPSSPANHSCPLLFSWTSLHLPQAPTRHSCWTLLSAEQFKVSMHRKLKYIRCEHDAVDVQSDVSVSNICV